MSQSPDPFAPFQLGPVTLRNRFIRAVRPVLQSGAAFQASALELRAPARAAPAKTGAKTGGKRKGKQHAAGELQLPLMTGMKRGRE